MTWTVGTPRVAAPPSVKARVGRVLMKLDLRNRVQAVIRAYELGLVRA